MKAIYNGLRLIVSRKQQTRQLTSFFLRVLSNVFVYQRELSCFGKNYPQRNFWYALVAFIHRSELLLKFFDSQNFENRRVEQTTVIMRCRNQIEIEL